MLGRAVPVHRGDGSHKEIFAVAESSDQSVRHAELQRFIPVVSHQRLEQQNRDGSYTHVRGGVLLRSPKVKTKETQSGEGYADRCQPNNKWERKPGFVEGQAA
jgi:hypothetical protein